MASGAVKVVLDCIILLQNNSNVGTHRGSVSMLRVLPDFNDLPKPQFSQAKGITVFQSGRVAGVSCGTARGERKDKMEIMFSVEMTGS